MLARLKLGMFDPPERVPYARIPYSRERRPPSTIALARRVAQESIVLLKNERPAAAVAKDLKTIAVIGPNADDVMTLLGNYYGTPSQPVTILDGIRSAVGAAHERALRARRRPGRGTQRSARCAADPVGSALRPRAGSAGARADAPSTSAAASSPASRS